MSHSHTWNAINFSIFGITKYSCLLSMFVRVNIWLCFVATFIVSGVCDVVKVTQKPENKLKKGTNMIIGDIFMVYAKCHRKHGIIIMWANVKEKVRNIEVGGWNTLLRLPLLNKIFNKTNNKHTSCILKYHIHDCRCNNIKKNHFFFFFAYFSNNFNFSLQES